MNERIAGSWREQSVPDATKKYYRLFDTSNAPRRKGTLVFSDQQVQPTSVIAGILVNNGETVVYSQTLKKGRRDRRKLQTSLEELRFPRFDDKELKQILKSFTPEMTGVRQKLVNLFKNGDKVSWYGLPRYRRH